MLDKEAPLTLLESDFSFFISGDLQVNRVRLFGWRNEMACGRSFVLTWRSGLTPNPRFSYVRHTTLCRPPKYLLPPRNALIFMFVVIEDGSSESVSIVLAYFPSSTCP